MWRGSGRSAAAAAAAFVVKRRGHNFAATTTAGAASAHRTTARRQGKLPTSHSRRRQKHPSGRYTTSTRTAQSDTTTPAAAVGGEVAGTDAISLPTRTQLWRVFAKAAVPMIGFGFTDQTVMLQAGNAIDCTLGVTFGLSTLTAAAFGQVCSDASGVIFGGTLERLSTMAGLPSAGLTTAQRHLPVVQRVRWAGSLLGVMFGCCLGLVNLFFIDTTRSSTLKLQAFNEEQEFGFTIEASNAKRKDATALTVRGPDVDGLLASMTAALAVRGCSLVELHARRSHTNLEDGSAPVDPEDREIEDVFYVIRRDTGEPFDDDELGELAKGLLDATRTPMNVNSVKAAMHELENTNSHLQARIQKLEEAITAQQITVIKSSEAAPGGK